MLFMNSNSRRQHGQLDCNIHHWLIQFWWNSCLQSTLIDDDSTNISPSKNGSKQMAHCGNLWACCVWSHVLSTGGSLQRSALFISSLESLRCSSIDRESYLLHTNALSTYLLRSSGVMVSSFGVAGLSFSAGLVIEKARIKRKKYFLNIINSVLVYKNLHNAPINE